MILIIKKEIKNRNYSQFLSRIKEEGLAYKSIMGKIV